MLCSPYCIDMPVLIYLSTPCCGNIWSHAYLVTRLVLMVTSNCCVIRLSINVFKHLQRKEIIIIVWGAEKSKTLVYFVQRY
jgi:hypothetical protein